MNSGSPHPPTTPGPRNGGRKKLATAFLVAWPAAEMIGTATVAAIVAVGVTDTSLAGRWQAVLFIVALGIAGGIAYMSWDLRSSLREAREEINPGETPATAHDVEEASEKTSKLIEELRSEVEKLSSEIESLRRPWWKFWR